MSFDIVQKLRCILKGNPVAQSAADEIERLRQELDEAHDALEQEISRSCHIALATPADDTALRERLRAEREKVVELGVSNFWWITNSEIADGIRAMEDEK